MPSSRVKKSFKNICYGMATQVLTVALNFVARVKFVEVLGGAANGLNGLFTEVVAMLALAELGVGSAITFSLYKPLAERDEKKISRLMWLFRTAYMIIAAVILVAGICLTPFIHLIVKGTDFELSYIRRIFILFVLRTVSTYLMAYKTSLLSADQKTYIVSAASAASKMVSVVLCIISLYIFKSFEVYLIIIIISNLLMNLFISIYSKKQYPFLDFSEKLPKNECKEILSNIKHVFISRVSGKITNSTDNILISILVSTLVAGNYSNYSLIITSVKQLFEQVMNAMTGSFGNLMVTESKERCEATFRRLVFMFFSFGVFLGAGLISASEPFIEQFFGKEFLIDDFTLFVCSFNLFLSIWVIPLWHIMSIMGLFKYDKRTSIAGSVLNLIVSIILGKMLGMAGIFIGTTCTYITQVILKLYYLYKYKFEMSAKKFYGSTVLMFAVALAVIFLEKTVCGYISTPSLLLSFFLKGVASAAMSVAIVVVLYCRTSEFKYFVNLVLKKLKRA